MSSFFVNFARFFVCISAPLLLPLAAVPAIAGTVGQSPFSWSSVSPNGEFIFVGLSPVPIEDQLQLARELERFSTEEGLKKFEDQLRVNHARYSSSGMYRLNDPDALLWNTSSWEDFGFPSDDGMQLAVIAEGINENASSTDILRVHDARGSIRVISRDQIISDFEQRVAYLLLGDAIYIDPSTVAINKSGTGYSFRTTLGDEFQVAFFGEPSVRRLSQQSAILQIILRSRRIVAALAAVFLVGMGFALRNRFGKARSTPQARRPMSPEVSKN